MNQPVLAQPLPAAKPPKPLNVRQKLFCDWYIKLGGNGTQAAIKAGYSEKSARIIASEYLTKPNIKAYIDLRKHQLEELMGFNKATIIEDLHKIKARCMQAKPVMVWDKEARDFVQVTEVNEDGEEVGMYEFDSQGAIRAIENINKMMGYNELEKDEGDGPAPTTNILIVNKLYDHQASNRSDEKTD